MLQNSFDFVTTFKRVSKKIYIEYKHLESI